MSVIQDIPETPPDDPAKGTIVPPEATTDTEGPNRTAGNKRPESTLEEGQPTKKRKWNIVDHFGPSELAQGVLIDPHANQRQPRQRYKVGDDRVRHLMEAVNKCYE